VKSFDVRIGRSNLVPFIVKKKRLKALLDRVPAEPRDRRDGAWSEAIRQIGSDLMLMLVHDQALVLQELSIVKGLSMAEGVEMGLCFEVDQVLYPIPFEALKALEIRAEERYWLQDALLWRSVPGCESGRPPLFTHAKADDRPINCLLIAADCGGDVALPNPQEPDRPHHRHLPILTGTFHEIESILDQLMQPAATGIGRIMQVYFKEGAVYTRETSDGQRKGERLELDPFDEVLERLLKEEGPWDMVHFAGHSDFVGPQGKEIGYLFVPRLSATGRVTEPKAIGVAAIAPLLTDARFVYLSGCSSAHWKVVYDLCAHRVPAMTGYRWKILEPSALQCAKSFYKHLLQSRCIERAMRSSWNEIYGNRRDDWAWASSQFVIQG
jgi:hypothetical protein